MAAVQPKQPPQPTQPTQSIQLEDEVMYGWLVCRYDERRVHNILYGQFARTSLPPESGWVFLARDAAEGPAASDVMRLSHQVGVGVVELH
jgi:hypothetical protein